MYSDFNGKPDQATFTPPSIDVAEYNAQVGWAEDEITFRRTLTIKIGARLDHRSGISPDAGAVDGSFASTSATIPGLATLLTWTTVSPRAGVDLELTDSGDTVLRGNVGRYYDPIALQSIEAVHPGIAVTTLARFDPVTARYSTIISVTDPRANLRFDGNMSAPHTDQYSIGIDRQLANGMLLRVTRRYANRWQANAGYADSRFRAAA